MNDSAIDIAILTGLVLSAIWAVLSSRRLRAVIGLAMASVCVTLALFRLDAPLAGVFELSVCAGLISAVFISTISLTAVETEESVAVLTKERTRRFWYLPPLMLLIAVGVMQHALPLVPEAPSSGADVREVLWSQRHLDLLGQVTILLAGAFGVIVLFKSNKKIGLPNSLTPQRTSKL
jgi:NADH-quinone oxidoreductase subunit J